MVPAHHDIAAGDELLPVQGDLRWRSELTDLVLIAARSAVEREERADVVSGRGLPIQPRTPAPLMPMIVRIATGIKLGPAIKAFGGNPELQLGQRSESGAD